jgi:hypothetical protein
VRIYEGSWTEYSTTELPVATGPEKAIWSQVCQWLKSDGVLYLQDASVCAY